MQVIFYLRHIETKVISNVIEMEVGKYNEFYLPSISPNHEAWIIIKDLAGEDTKIHLKR